MWATAAGTPDVTGAAYSGANGQNDANLGVIATCTKGVLGSMTAVIGAGKGIDTEKIKAGMTWKAFAGKDNNDECTVSGTYVWADSGATALVATVATLYAASSMTF